MKLSTKENLLTFNFLRIVIKGQDHKRIKILPDSNCDEIKLILSNSSKPVVTLL